MLWYENIDVIDCFLVICWFLWVASIGIQLYFYFNYFIPFARLSNSTAQHKPVPVSLIIAVKNEAQNLTNHLPLWIKQELVEFELIIVDDHSSDQTQSILQSFNDERLQVYQLDNESGKKSAIQLAISKASYNHLVFTDADCVPSSDYWLVKMASNFTDDHQIVLGHSGYFKEHGFLNLLQRFENTMVAAQYFSFASKGNAYMGVGRNLAYTKTIFENSSVFNIHKNIRSGDDDLLVNEMATTKNVALEWDEKAQTISRVSDNWMTYFQQKRRQLQAGEQYKRKHKFQLATFGSSTLLLNILTLILLYISENFGTILMTFGLTLVLKSIIFNKISKKLSEQNFIPWFWLLEFVLIISQTIIGVSTWFWKVKRWK